jgi:polyisoprenoid-binding protein YceI
MKKVSTLILALFVAFQLTSCGSDKKEEKKEKKSDAAFVLSDAKNKVAWTAYKFTEKTPVGGEFRKVNITGGGEGNTVKDAINNAEFSIPISSVFTKNSDRDYKIKKFFFGIMQDPELLSGKLMIENDSMGHAHLTMNGITNKLPFKYTIKGKEFSMTTKMDVVNWNAQSSIDSLNSICNDLHKGLDGVSKLWSEVAINVNTTFK